MVTKRIWVLLAFMLAFSAKAQSPWPAVQSNMYPYINGMAMTRHEQTILLGEGDQQTGIFFTNLKNTFTEQVQNELILDGQLKYWSLHSLVRLGTSYILTRHISHGTGISRQVKLVCLRCAHDFLDIRQAVTF